MENQIDIVDEIKKLVPVLGKENASRVERAYLLGEEETKKRIVEMIDTLKASISSDPELKDAVLMEPLPKTIATKGDLEIGTVLYGRKKLYPLRIDKKILLTHVGIFGSSGYGKTNIVYRIIENLSRQKIPVLIFDFQKRNYRDLLQLPELKDMVKIYTAGREISPFRFNPLKPPEGIQISQWAKEFAEVFDHAYWMLGGGRHVMLKALDDVYKLKKNPRIRDLKDWLSEYGITKISARERNWIATAERPLESLCFRDTAKVFDCDKGIEPCSFFENGKITVLELDALATNDRTFLIEIILQWIRDWQLIHGKKEELAGVIILEEAHHVLNREIGKRMGMESVIDLIFREIRELGIGMIYIDQHPSLISYPALGNTSTHIYMNLGLDTQHSSDILDASNMLGLDYNEEGEYLRKLPVGHAFMLCRRLSFPHPFLVEFPLVPIKKGLIKDEMISSAKKEETATDKKPDMPSQVEKTVEIGEVGQKIINALGNGDACATSEIYTEIRVSGSAFKREVEKLIEMGLVGSKEAKVYKQNAVCYYLTDRGYDMFEKRFEMKYEANKLDINEVKEFFKIGGWECHEGDGFIAVRKPDHISEQITINLGTNLDRNEIYDKIRKAREPFIYFLCGSERILSMVVQQCAKYSAEHKKSITLFIAVFNKLGEENRFKKIEFKA